MTLEEKISDLRLDAREEGKAEGKAEAILDLLMEYGEIAEQVKQTILEEQDLNQLKKWLKLAAKVDSIQKFVENM